MTQWTQKQAETKLKQIICPKCQRRTTRKSLESKGMCATCFRMSKLKPYHANKIREVIRRRHARDGVRWDQVVSEIRANWQPPPGVERWEIWHVIDLDSARLNWGNQ